MVLSLEIRKMNNLAESWGDSCEYLWKQKCSRQSSYEPTLWDAFKLMYDKRIPQGRRKRKLNAK
jgi:hypothetical protein